MAQPVTADGHRVSTLASWQGVDTTIGEVERALSDVRRAESRAAMRTSVLTLVVVADEEECDAFLATIREMATAHPSHTVVLVLGAPDAPARCDADVEVHVIEREGAAVCFEDVVLRLAGPAVAHLESVIEPFTLPDLPVVVWLPGGLTPLDDPLLAAADRVLVDTKEAGVDALGDLVALTRRFPVVDLSWVRLLPWRELLAGIFESEATRPFVHGVTRVRVSGKPGPRHLLAGWLLTRLRLSPSAVELVEARHASIELHAEVDGRRGDFHVVRHGVEPLLDTMAEIDGGPSLARTLRLRDRSPARVLGLALARLGHDRVYEQALAGAAELATAR